MLRPPRSRSDLTRRQLGLALIRNTTKLPSISAVHRPCRTSSPIAAPLTHAGHAPDNWPSVHSTRSRRSLRRWSTRLSPIMPAVVDQDLVAPLAEWADPPGG